MSKYMIVFVFLISNTWANTTFDILELVGQHKYRKASKLIHKNKGNLKTENEFGEKVDKTDKLKSIITKIKKESRSCDEELKDAEGEKLPEGTDYILEQFKLKCSKYGELGAYIKKIRVEFKNNDFYQENLSKLGVRAKKIQGRWDRFNKAEDKRYSKINAKNNAKFTKKQNLVKKFKNLGCIVLSSFTVKGPFSKDGYPVKLLKSRSKDKCLKKARRNSPCSRWRYRDNFVSARYTPLTQNLKVGQYLANLPAVKVPNEGYMEAPGCTKLFKQFYK